MDQTGFDDPRMEIKYGGLTERGAEATNFLIQAFYGALFLMFIILEMHNQTWTKRLFHKIQRL